jgi:Holliday junction resolvasome RuvABC endonuclease subunit|tara:strand:+ start:399 stop:920 length:522 start_codon:yes stop_codon:yes gene_type:complete
MVTLGLDISTSTVGYAFTKNQRILDMGFIDIKKLNTYKKKAFFILSELDKNKHMKNVDKIYIEDNLSGFMGGRTSQQTIIKLAKFNAILGYVLEDEFEIEVQNINPSTARKQVFGKARVKGIKAKDFVKMKIEEMYDTSKWCKETKRGNWDKRNIDMYDGLVMSLYESKNGNK